MNTGILCPSCNGPNHAIEKTEPHLEYLRRIRKCSDCAKQFTTYEGAGHAGGRFMRVLHLQHAIQSMTPARRRLLENLIVELGGDGP